MVVLDRGRSGLAIWACLLRICLVVAVFDVYFRSPVVGSDGGAGGASARCRFSGVAPSIATQTLLAPAPAHRLTLLVADGLRADAFVDARHAASLKYIASNRGTWGVSNTRIPTESRPGHVAMIAGFYEDPSAITKGWKENPVEFDSVFNQSRYTWSWGSPDILPMFAKGASGDHVYTYSYSREEEDFSGKISTSKLDEWVFDRVEQFFKNAKSDRTLMNKLKQDKIILFLHLLGLDTAGHTHKPHSIQYDENIKTVDEGITKIENIINDFFDHDNRTAYIFTSDHGMTDWGSHGAGSDHETKTPIIAWGSGIASSFSNFSEDTFYSNNINQADICPLMATLIGIDIPIDSVGILPDNYLNAPIKDKIGYLYKNMEQTLTHFDLKKQLIEKTAIKSIYTPFAPLTDDEILNKLNAMENMYKSEEFDDLIVEIKNMMHLCMAGSNYYQNYYQNILLKCMTANFLSWIFWLLTILLKDTQIIDKSQQIATPKRSSSTKISNFNIAIHFIAGGCLFISFYFIYVQQLPKQYYIYFALPIFHWWKVVTSWRLWYEYFRRLKTTSTTTFRSIFSLICLIIMYLAGILVLIFSFFHRWSLSIGLFGLAIFPLFNSNRRNVPRIILSIWIISCILLSIFSFLPVIGKQDNIHLVGGSGLLWFILSFVFIFIYSKPMLESGKETKMENVVMLVPLLMMITAIQNKYFVAFNFTSKSGLPLISQCISWILALTSVLVPTFSSRWIISRLFSINTSLAVFFILLTVAHEGFFLLVLSINLICWIAIEHYLVNNVVKLTQISFDNEAKAANVNKLISPDRKLNSDDFRRAFIFLLYIILAFFGTGNIASINSFDPQWVRCFIAQFSPFIMTALILCKTLIPFLCVTCAFYAVNLIVKAPTGNLFLIMIVYSDLMGLSFLHKITNEGSWLDIGTSISHYVIMESTVFFVTILYGIAQLLTRSTFWKNTDKSKRLKKV